MCVCVALFAQSRRDLHYNVEEEKRRGRVQIFLLPDDDDNEDDDDDDCNDGEDGW